MFIFTIQFYNLKNLLYFLLFSLFFSCSKEQKETKDTQTSKPLLSVVKEHFSVQKVNSTYIKEIEDWKELIAVDNFMARFKKASPNEVLSNALELKGLVKSLKDSVKPKLFSIQSFNARVNILYNETLRLADMTFIPSIEAKKINEQTDKVLEAFSAINSKVNSLLSKKRFEEAIDVDVSFIGLDSTKIDTVSKQSIKKEFLDQKLKKKKKVYYPKKKKPLSLKKETI